MKKRFSITYRRERGDTVSHRAACAMATGFVETAFFLNDSLRPEALAAMRSEGIEIEALYLPSEGVNLLWDAPLAVAPAEDALPSDTPVLDDGTWDSLRELYAAYFSFAANLGVQRVILFPSVGTALAPVNQTGISRFGTLAALAKERGVRLLVENEQSAPHFEAVVRAVCDGYHAVSFSPARAWRHYGSSSLPSYAQAHIERVALDDAKGDAFGFLPFDGDTDYRPFARSLAGCRFRGTFAVLPDEQLPLYGDMDIFALSSRAYDGIGTFLRMLKKEEALL